MPSNALAFGFLAFLVGMLIMLQKREMIDLQAISCYALLQVSKFLPSVCPGLIHRSHVPKTALIEVLVDLTFKTNR